MSPFQRSEEDSTLKGDTKCVQELNTLVHNSAHTQTQLIKKNLPTYLKENYLSTGGACLDLSNWWLPYNQAQ